MRVFVSDKKCVGKCFVMEGKKYISHISSSTITEKTTYELQLCCQLLIAHLAFCFIPDQSEKRTHLLKSGKYHQPTVWKSSFCLFVCGGFWLGCFWGVVGIGRRKLDVFKVLKTETDFLCKTEKVKTQRLNCLYVQGQIPL